MVVVEILHDWKWLVYTHFISSMQPLLTLNIEDDQLSEKCLRNRVFCVPMIVVEILHEWRESLWQGYGCVLRASFTSAAP